MPRRARDSGGGNERGRDDGGGGRLRGDVGGGDVGGNRSGKVVEDFVFNAERDGDGGMKTLGALEIVGMALRLGLSCSDRWFKKSGWMSPCAENNVASSFCSTQPFDCEKMWPKRSCCEANW